MQETPRDSEAGRDGGEARSETPVQEAGRSSGATVARTEVENMLAGSGVEVKATSASPRRRKKTTPRPRGMSERRGRSQPRGNGDRPAAEAIPAPAVQAALVQKSSTFSSEPIVEDIMRRTDDAGKQQAIDEFIAPYFRWADKLNQGDPDPAARIVFPETSRDPVTEA
jgi:hypothetical protein